MVKVRASAVRWDSDEFPGWVDVVLRDGSGRHHRITEKVPVVAPDLTASSSFPVEIWIDADVSVVDGDQVWVTLRHHVESVEGARPFLVAADGVDLL